MPTGYESGKAWSPIGAQATVSTSAASRVWTLNEVAAYEGADSWPAPIGPVQLITSSYPSSSVSSITLSGIPQTFSALIVDMALVGDSTTYNQFQLKTNSLSSSSDFKYAGANFAGANGSNGAPSLTTGFAGTVGLSIGGTSTIQADPSQPVKARCFIPNYTASTVNKIVHGVFYANNYTQRDYANGVGEFFVGRINDNAAITSITLSPRTSTYNGGSYSVHPIGVSLYGMKA